MMQRLYRPEDDRYCPAASQIDTETQQALQPIFDRWIEAGYSARDIASVVMHAVFELELAAILDWGDRWQTSG
jgi:hypothetical protein